MGKYYLAARNFWPGTASIPPMSLGVIEIVLAVGAALAAAAVLAISGIGLVVWRAGRNRNPPE